MRRTLRFRLVAVWAVDTRFPVSLRLLVGTRRFPDGHVPMGAGYIGGATAYFAVKCNDSHGYKRRPLQVGITRNGNRTPLFPYSYVASNGRRWG